MQFLTLIGAVLLVLIAINNLVSATVHHPIIAPPSDRAAVFNTLNSLNSTISLPATWPINIRLAARDYYWVSEFGSDVSRGAYVRGQRGDAPPNHRDDFRVVIKNDKSVTAWFRVELSYNIGHRDGSGPWERIRLDPGTSVEIGGFPDNPFGPGEGGERASFAIRQYVDCTWEGFWCAGIENSKIKLEFTLDSQGQKGIIAINLSKVDGINSAGYITYGPGSGCPGIGCHYQPWELREKCPSRYLWEDRGELTCRSDCNNNGDAATCCRGSPGEPVYDYCQPTSQYLHAICPDGYAWPREDQHMNTCFPGNEVKLTVY